jgi:hypothetical protein
MRSSAERFHASRMAFSSAFGLSVGTTLRLDDLTTSVLSSSFAPGFSFASVAIASAISRAPTFSPASQACLHSVRAVVELIERALELLRAGVQRDAP